MIKSYIGIDPGINGGITVINKSGEIVSSIKMPSTSRDLLDHLLIYCEDSFCIFEKVSSRPTNGAKSNFTFGRGIGQLEMALIALSVPSEDITPMKWMKMYHFTQTKTMLGGTAWKNMLKSKAQQLYPKQKVFLWNADSILIAHYCYHTYKNN